MEAARGIVTDRPARGRWEPIQVGVFWISLALLAWSVAGLIANPDFTTGADATSVRVLGVDFNGWHAVSGFLLFGPGLFLAMRRDWALLFAGAAILGIAGTGVWALFDHRPAGLFPFDHNHGDAIFHFVSASAYGVLLLAHLARRRSAG